MPWSVGQRVRIDDCWGTIVAVRRKKNNGEVRWIDVRWDSGIGFRLHRKYLPQLLADKDDNQS